MIMLVFVSKFKMYTCIEEIENKDSMLNMLTEGLKDVEVIQAGLVSSNEQMLSNTAYVIARSAVQRSETERSAMEVFTRSS